MQGICRTAGMAGDGSADRQPYMLRSVAASVSFTEADGETAAEARLDMDNAHLAGRGKARLNPADRDVMKIGAEIAVARALSDLAHKLLNAAAADIEGITHQRARLHL
jgi:Domain of unknown function (DUF1876)